MTATEIQITIGAIDFNTSFTPGPGMYLLRNTEEILDALRTRRSDTPKQGEHGSEDSQSTYEPRILVFRGEIHATTQAERVTMQQNLDRALTLARSQSFDGDDGYKLVEIVDEDGIAKQIYAKIEQMPKYELVEEGMPESRRFEFLMFAADPTVYSQSLTTADLEESFDSTTFTIQDGDLPTFKDGDLPTFQDVLGSLVLVTNAGTMGTPPSIIITGPTTNPVVMNETSGKRIAFTRNGGVALLVGESLTINVAAKTAMKTDVDGDESSVRSKISLDSKWWDVLPGDNEISLFDDTPADLTSQLEVQFRDAWV